MTHTRPRILRLTLQEARAFGALCSLLIAFPAIFATYSERTFSDVITISLFGLLASVTLFIAILLTRQKRYITALALYLLGASAVGCLLITAFWKW